MSSLIISSPNSVPFIKVGPFGGSGGDSWDDGSHVGIRRIDIRSGDWINSIGCVYDNPDVNAIHHGGEGGSLHSVILDYPNEYINSFSGYVGTEEGKLLVNSLTFRTNYNKTHGPFGTESGIPFSYAPENERIVGFHGRSGTYVDSIGVHMFPSGGNPIIPLKTFGPFGGNGGESWDDGSHLGIRQIDIRSGDWINSIGCVYDNPDANVIHHGGEGGSLQSITLDYPNEYIDSFSGHVGTEEDKLVVNSLTFHTNYNKTYGPFGTEDGMTFSYASSKEKIVGFHGRSGVYVDSIGVHLLRF